jgi:hypothetical protein
MGPGVGMRTDGVGRGAFMGEGVYSVMEWEFRVS